MGRSRASQRGAGDEAIAGIQRLDAGTIVLDGIPVARRSPAQHRAIQRVFQDPFSSLNPRYASGKAGDVVAAAGACPFAPRCPQVTGRCLSKAPELARLAAGGDEHLAACHYRDDQPVQEVSR